MAVPPLRSATVEVPATSANLGPGFDSLGVALDWRARFTLMLVDDPLPTPEPPLERMAAAGVRALHLLAGEAPPAGVRVSVAGDIPVGRGLGLSAAAHVAGVVAADALLPGERSVEALLQVAARLEGHADNAAPALLGGLQIVVAEGGEGELHRLGVDPPEDLRIALLVPSFSMPTRESRERLPERLTRNQAVHNIGRAAMLVAALAERRYELLAVATEDVLHQPARATLFPAMPAVFRAALAAGRLSDHIGKTRVALAGSTAMVVFLVVIPATAGFVMYAALGMVGLSAATRVAPLQSLVTQLVTSEHRGAFVALRNTLSQCGNATAAALASILYPLGFQYICWLTAGFSAMAVVLILFIEEPEQGPELKPEIMPEIMKE